MIGAPEWADMLVDGAIVAVLFLVAMPAAPVPAPRAARVDTVTALREE
jgi:hypothetical protein